MPFPQGNRETFWRSLQTFCLTRLVITILLLVYLNISTGKDARALDALVTDQASAAYLGLAVLFAVMAVYVRQRFVLQLLAQVGVDILVISKLYIAAGGATSGLAILYLFPLAGCAILAPLTIALFAAAVVALVLLGEGGYQLLSDVSANSTYQAGLYGGAFFIAAFTINRLAARVIKQEGLALQRGQELSLQEAINRLVVADMGDGVLVLAQDGEVHAGNPAVERMLGLPLARMIGARLAGIASLTPIDQAYRAWKSREDDDGAVEAYVMIKADGEHGAGLAEPGVRSRKLVAHLKLRFARVDVPGSVSDSSRSLIFMRDVSEIENQAQQLKLASMGRLTASIAHEVRNPLSAISHATSLLREDIADPIQARLLSIVGDNVRRLDRMVEDILKLSRKAQTQEGPLCLESALDEIVGEFREANALAPRMIDVGDMAGCKVRFDPLHLREVLTNLLSNALRYASGDDGCIRIRARQTKPGQIELHVQDDGVPITPEVRAHLFEPFYTTSSKGTGLGLYLARELCLNNGAMLDYEFRADDGGSTSGRFVITFASERT